MITSEELQQKMNQCYGTEVYYKHPLFPRFNYTEGVKVFCESAEAYWFLTDVFVKLQRFFNGESFVSIHLVVKDSKADLLFCDGDDKPLRKGKYSYTDCPEGDWQFFFIDGVLLWHMEY